MKDIRLKLKWVAPVTGALVLAIIGGGSLQSPEAYEKTKATLPFVIRDLVQLGQALRDVVFHTYPINSFLVIATVLYSIFQLYRSFRLRQTEVTANTIDAEAPASGTTTEEMHVWWGLRILTKKEVKGDKEHIFILNGSISSALCHCGESIAGTDADPLAFDKPAHMRSSHAIHYLRCRDDHYVGNRVSWEEFNKPENHELRAHVLQTGIESPPAFYQRVLQEFLKERRAIELREKYPVTSK